MVDRPPTPALPPETNYLAETRTLLAGLRTGFSISGVGGLASQALLRKWPEWVAVLLSTPFVLIGCIPMWVAVNRQRVLRKRARASGYHLEQPTWLYLPVVLILQGLILAVLVLCILRR